MPLFRYLMMITLLGAQLSVADTRHYRTEPAAPGSVTRNIEIPLIEIDPDTGEKKVYLRPPRQEHPTLIATADYPAQGEEGQASIHQAIDSLYQQMETLCPQGWVKLDEWAVAEAPAMKLHYAFACIDR